MTGRGGYVAALVAAVLVLVGSVIAVVAFTATSGPLAMHRTTQSSSADGWRQGLAGGGMMGSGTAGTDQYRAMMGRSGGAMMGNWNDNGATITPEAAQTTADAWVAANQPGAAAGQAVQMPMGYLFTVSKDGKAIGRLIVDDDSGAVSWVQYSTQPTTAPSAS